MKFYKHCKIIFLLKLNKNKNHFHWHHSWFEEGGFSEDLNITGNFLGKHRLEISQEQSRRTINPDEKIPGTLFS